MRHRVVLGTCLLALAAQVALLAGGGDPPVVIDGEVKALPSATATETPVPGAQVWAFLRGAAPVVNRPGSPRTLTDAQGKFRFALTPGRYTIVIHGGLTREFITCAHQGLGNQSKVNTLLARTIDERGPRPTSVSVTRASLDRIRNAIPVETPEQKDVKEYRQFLDDWIEDRDVVLKKAMDVLVPAYFNPADRPDDRKKLAKAAEKDKGKLQLFAIVNPANGPGAQLDANYPPVLQACAKSSVRLIGYIALNFGKASEADLRKAVDSYRKWYPQVDGFFLDELDDADTSVKVARGLATYARNALKPPKGSTRRPAFLVGNPGKTIAAGPLVKDRVLDSLCVYENDARPVRFAPPDWSAGERGQGVCALVYDLPKEDGMRRVMAGLLGAGVNMVYLTDA